MLVSLAVSYGVMLGGFAAVAAGIPPLVVIGGIGLLGTSLLTYAFTR